MKKISVGLFGLTFCSSNLGCSALAYSFRKLLGDAANKLNLSIDLIIFTNVSSTGYIYAVDGFESQTIVQYSFKRPKTLLNMLEKISGCDVVFDFTEGDSFTDLYGMKRFLLTILTKKWVTRNSILILGPQTYGPFNHRLSTIFAIDCVKRASHVYTRDIESARLIKDISGVKADVTTDVAFLLPYKNNRSKESKAESRGAIGINISGLLWNGGYTGKNQFNLRTNYKEYCSKLVKSLENDGWQIHIVPHVVGSDGNDEDYRISEEFCRNHPTCKLAPRFSSPMEAKNYIARLSIFIGARMHATVAAFSSGVVTIPFAYSKKFKGLFGSLGYNYIVDGRESDTEDSLRKTLQYVQIKDELKLTQQSALKIANENLSNFFEGICADLESIR